MNLRSVILHPSFCEARAWALGHGPAPRRWPPQGLARLDDTWLAHHPLLGPRRPSAPAFQGLPPDLAPRAIQACGAAGLASRRLPTALCEACARHCWSDLVDLPLQTEDSLGLVDGATAATDALAGGSTAAETMAEILPLLPAATIMRGMSLAGLADLGGLLTLAPDRAAAAVCGRLPPQWRERVWRARASGGQAPTRARLAAMGEMLGARDPTEVLFSLGARHFAGLLARRPLELQQTAQLLPVPAARLLLAGTEDPEGDAGATAHAAIPAHSTGGLAPIAALREAAQTTDASATANPSRPAEEPV